MADSRTYIKLHDGMPDHPKVVGLSDSAFRLYVQTLCWCSRHLTDGAVPAAAMRKLGSARAVKELAVAGLIEADGSDWIVHDYLEHQRSAAEVDEIRRKKQEAGRKGGKTRAANQATAKHVLEQKPSESQASAQAKSNTETETETETDLSRGSLDRHLPPQTREAPDEDDELDEITAKIEGRIVELLRETTGRTIDRPWASKVRKQLLDDRDVRDPLRYISAAIRGEPQKYLPSAAPVEAGNQVLAHLRSVDRDATAAATERGAPAVREAMAAAKARRAEAGTEPTP